MAIENFKPIWRPGVITAFFADGGILEKAGGVWTYESDGRSSTGRDPESAVIGAEGISLGRTIFEGKAYLEMEKLEGGE